MMCLTWNIELFTRNLFSLHKLITQYNPDLIFLAEPQLYLLPSMTHFRGEYSSSLNSEDLYDMDLPLRNPKAKGGTMVMWKIALDPYVTIHRTDCSSFLPIVVSLPNSPPAIHIALYLPTRGKECEFLEALADLRILLDELIQKYQDPVIFLRGDANASSTNTMRIPLIKQFIQDFNLKLVNVDHKTYHHFMGQGISDSDLDILLYSNQENVNEQLVHLRCGQVDQLIDSHHDVLISACNIPSSLTSNVLLQPLHSAPRIENNRHKIIWSEKGAAEYEVIISNLLPGLRNRWLLPSSQASTSVLLQSTNALLTLAASISNRVVSLASPISTKSERLPKEVRKSGNDLSKLNSEYRHLVHSQAPEIRISLIKARLKYLKNNHRKLIRQSRVKKNLHRDNKLQDRIKANKAIKHAKNSSSRDIHKLRVGDKVYEGPHVPDGFYHSISSLKTIDDQILSSSESYISASETYKCILKICKAGEKVPPLNSEKAYEILKSLRPSVNDFHSITALHYLKGGKPALDHFQFLLNTAIEDLNNLTVEELNMVWACILYKGHEKDRYSDRSYRTISTCPLISKAIDSYIASLYSSTWNSFTSVTQFQGVSSSHELAGLTLTEAITHSTKVLSKPVFVIYLDARSAFDLALKEFIINNIFHFGIRDQGLLLIDQRLANRRTVCEWNKILMGPIQDQCGVEQGGINSSDFYKIYNNEQLDLAQSSEFGVELGPVVISSIGQADDVALLANNLHALQGLVDLTQYYCKKYCVSLSTEKTKLQVYSPSNKESETFLAKCTSLLNVNGDPIEFVDNTEHVGILRSTSGNLPHILSRLTAHRRAMFGILPSGTAMAHRGNPAVNLKTHSIYCTPVLFSGVASLKLSSSEVTLLDQHIKVTVQRLQKLQDKTPHCVCLFMGGHLPGRALYHLRLFSLFGMITRTPDSYPNKIANYQLTCAKMSSGSWFLTIRDLCLMYSLPSPLSLLQYPMSKSKFKNLVRARITDYWEAHYRSEAHKLSNSSLKYFKPEYMSLAHPHKIWTTCGSNPFEVHKAVVQARMLSGRYITDRLSRHWRHNKTGICSIPGCTGLDIGSLEHYLLFCPALSQARSKVVSLMEKVAAESDLIGNIFEKAFTNQTPEHTVQFILDCTSFPDIILLEQSGNISLVS